MVAVAVGELVDEQVVADEQRVLHRARRDVEGLEDQRADDDRDEQSLEADLDDLAEAALSDASFLSVVTLMPVLSMMSAAGSPRRVIALARAGGKP